MENTKEKSECISLLKSYKGKITPHQYSTIKGQILAGDIEGAKKGLARITQAILRINS